MKNKIIMVIIAILIISIVGGINANSIISMFTGNKNKIERKSVILSENLSAEMGSTSTISNFISESNDAEISNGGDQVDTSNLGTQTITIKFNDGVEEQEMNTTINIIDTTAPELVTKDVKTEENTSVAITDFITSCSDNSKKECNYKYLENNEETDTIALGIGTRQIIIEAFDESGNKVQKEVSLSITKKVTSKQADTNFPKSSTTNNTTTSQIDKPWIKYGITEQEYENDKRTWEHFGKTEYWFFNEPYLACPSKIFSTQQDCKTYAEQNHTPNYVYSCSTRATASGKYLGWCFTEEQGQ